MKKTLVLAFAMPALLIMFFIACTQPANDDSTGTNKTALATAISNAEAAIAAATVNDAAPSAVFEWVTAYVSTSDKTAYGDAVAAAKLVNADASATQAQVDTAVSDLATATTAFTAAKVSGSKVGVVGDTGPAGGKIFYVDSVDTYPGWKYLEAAPADFVGTYEWASTAFLLTEISGTATTIGTGKANTTTILATDEDAPAAKACDEYSYGGYNDWFLPSKAELNAMYTNKASIGGFASDYYWSSSEYDNSIACDQTFNGGGQYVDAKSYSFYVRAARAF
jgi:hypothetical protein